MPENAGHGSVTVTRDGDPIPPLSVHYDTRGMFLDAKPSKDFTPTSGTLTFAAGQTTNSFAVPIRNDSIREGPEDLIVNLNSPTGAIRGTPSMAVVEIRASDQRPDASISTQPASRYIGNNIYNSTGVHQARTQRVRPGQTRTYYVRVTNHSGDTHKFTLTGSRAPAGSRVRYFRGNTDITAKMRSSDGLSVWPGPHQHRQIKMTIRVEATAASGARKAATVRSTWRGDGTHIDVVKAVARVSSPR